MIRDRLPPQDIEAEEAVIGSLLIDNDAYLKVAAFLKPDDFASERTKTCYKACQALFDRSEAINQVTVAHQLGIQGDLEGLGGAAYLTHVLEKTPTSAHVEHYGRIVQRTAIMRRLINAAEDIAGIGYEAGPDVEASLTHAEDLLFRLRIGKGDRGFISLKDILDQYLTEKTERAANRPDAPSFVPTGFFDLDRLLGGLQRSDLVILAARPSVGKSALALNIGFYASRYAGAHVAVFSLEMGKEQLVDRLISGITKIDTHTLQKFRLGQGPIAQEGALMAAIGELSETPMWIDDTPSGSVVEMRSKARRLYMEKGLDLIIVDYLQLMGGGDATSRFSNNRVQEVSEISRSLKGMARDLDVPVLALSQLSRAVENRPNHRPQLSDLRESGSIEQDADIVMFIYREAMTQDDWERQHPEKPYPEGMAEIIVAKHRHGPIGNIQLFFDQRTTSFKNAALGK